VDGGVESPFPGVRLVALDIDGTLLRSDRTVSARTRHAIARARAIGVRVVLVTGRRHPSARRVADLVADGLPLVVHNGALVVEDGSIIRCRPLAREVAARAIVAGRARGLDPILHCGSRGEGLLLVEARARPAGLVGYYLERAREELRTVEDLLESLAREEPIQVMFGGTLAEMEGLVVALAAALRGDARIERTVYPATGFGLVDVLDPGVGKADALAFLQRRWGITAAQTLAIGDNWNDRSMLEAAGRGLLMGNAPSELLMLGLPVLPTNDEDGVAQAIETHVLS
jgi:hydroxymethylpyrimidine pyrophosphatase-like HAD family hydrolase